MRANAVAGLMSLLLLAPNASRGQAPAKLEFEVASVRASPALSGRDALPLGGAQSGGPGTDDPVRIVFSHAPLERIIADAFDLTWDQITGPDSAGQRYDIVAKVPEGSTAEQAMQMLQNLLVERFHLAYHLQTKVVPGYELTVAAGGSKLKESAADPNAPVPAARSDAASMTDEDGFPVLPPGVRQGMRAPRGRVLARFGDTSVSEFARWLGARLPPEMVREGGGIRSVSAPILDKTGLTERYDFTFDYAGTVVVSPGILPSIRSSVESALVKQLGLKLVEAKIPWDILVIDHVDKTPTEN